MILVTTKAVIDASKYPVSRLTWLEWNILHLIFEPIKTAQVNNALLKLGFKVDLVCARIIWPACACFINDISLKLVHHSMRLVPSFFRHNYLAMSMMNDENQMLTSHHACTEKKDSFRVNEVKNALWTFIIIIFIIWLRTISYFNVKKHWSSKPFVVYRYESSHFLREFSIFWANITPCLS